MLDGCTIVKQSVPASDFLLNWAIRTPGKIEPTEDLLRGIALKDGDNFRYFPVEVQFFTFTEEIPVFFILTHIIHSLHCPGFVERTLCTLPRNFLVKEELAIGRFEALYPRHGRQAGTAN